MENHRKANLVIVGAMKAGTTSFTNALAQHPHVYFSPIKEPNFFINELPEKIYTPSRFFSIEKYFEKDFPKPLHIAHVQNETQYEKLFSTSLKHHKYLADGSTAYLHAKESAEKIFSYNAQAKIIIILRNGLKRATSHYKMDVGLGRVTKPLEEVLEADWEIYKNKELSNWSYLGMSLYAENVERYKNFFKENVLIIAFEDLINNQQEVFKNVFSFLELDYFPLTLPHANESSTIKYQRALALFYKSGMKDLFSKMFPYKLRQSAFKLLKKESSSELELPDDLRNKLLNLFEEDMQKLKNNV